MSVTLLTSRTDLDSVVDQVLPLAREKVCIFDRDLALFRLEQPARVDMLRTFLASGTTHRLTIVLQDPEPFKRTSPRLTALLAQFGHRFELLASPASLDKLSDSLLLVDDRHGVVHFHRDQARGKVMLDAPAECAPYRKRFEAILAEGCTPQGSTTLGL